MFFSLSLSLSLFCYEFRLELQKQNVLYVWIAHTTRGQEIVNALQEQHLYITILLHHIDLVLCAGWKSRGLAREREEKKIDAIWFETQ